MELISTLVTHLMLEAASLARGITTVHLRPMTRNVPTNSRRQRFFTDWLVGLVIANHVHLADKSALATLILAKKW
ncbi:MAG TPA: hypothetical protein VH682_27445, partial [Gemmataceae bacterium]